MTTQLTNSDIRLLDGHFYARDPHPHFQWMREHAPVYWDESGGLWGIALYDDVMAVSRDPQTFCSSLSSRPDAAPYPSMINRDDPDHKRRRNLVNKGFTLRRVQDHEPKLRRICNELIDRVAPRGTCDFVKEIATPLPMIVIGDMLGVEPADYDMLLRWSDHFIAATSATAPPEIMDAAMKAFEEYADYNRRVVSDRHQHPREDLMSSLVHAEIDGERLTDEEILQEGLLILVGGDETTRHVISGGMEQLIRHPEQRRTLLADPSKITTAVEEILRWVTPIQN